MVAAEASNNSCVGKSYRFGRLHLTLGLGQDKSKIKMFLNFVPVAVCMHKPKIKVGVLALQGNFAEHIKTIEACGACAVEVRLPSDLNCISGLIIPGGESTTIGKLITWNRIGARIRQRYSKGMAVFGTCAGAILMANEIISSRQPKLALMDISIRRNAYGRQIESFEASLRISGLGNAKGIFIRAPVIQRIGKGVEVLAAYEGKPVLVRQGKLLAATFHPEQSGELKVHKMFLRLCQ